jgi:cytochrome c oxidase subunit IV
MTENADRNSWRTYISLALLLGGSILVSRLMPDPWRVALVLLFAGIQGLMLMLNFMRVRLHGPAIWIVAGASFVWLGILFALTLGDYLSRQIVF